MASGDNNTVNKAVELEVMSKEDSSWHPCQVSLCPSGVGVVVYYGNDDLEDTFVSEEETVARLRVRSNPLQGDDCTHIEQGEHILAAQKSKGPFFDAEVEEVVRVRHSKKVHCRCTFLIKWLHQDPQGGTLVVPSSSIMKLAKESIVSHPTVSAFFNAVRTILPLPTVGNDMDSELDLHELLGKQIEEISHSAASKKNIREDILLGFEVHTKGKIQCRPVAASIASKSQVQITPEPDHLRRSTRRSNKLQTETEVKDPPPVVPSIQKELPQNKSPVNPLAARAALASLMSKFPKDLEFSFYQKGEKCFTNSLEFTSHKQVNLEPLNVTEYVSSSVTNNISLTGTFSSETEVASFVPKPDNIVKSLFSTRSASRKPQDLDVSSTIWTKDCEKGKKNPGVTNSSANFTCSIAEKNVSQSREATRVTRAAVQKVVDTSVDNIESKLMSATSSRRFTRSAVHKEEEIKTFETGEAVKENRSKSDETDTPDHNVIAQESFALKVKHEVVVGSSLDNERDSISPKAPKSLMTIERRSKKNDIESTTRVLERKNLGNTRRLTRSAVHKDIANTTMENIQGLVENKFPGNTDSSGGNFSPLGTTLSLHAEISLPPTEVRNKKRKMSAAFKTTQETEGDVFNDGGNSQSHKRKSTSSQMHEVRSSPRLRFLPRTRSQSKN